MAAKLVAASTLIDVDVRLRQDAPARADGRLVLVNIGGVPATEARLDLTVRARVPLQLVVFAVGLVPALAQELRLRDEGVRLVHLP